MQLIGPLGDGTDSPGDLSVEHDRYIVEGTRLEDLSQLAIVVTPQRDNVAVARSHIPAGTVILWQGQKIAVRADIPPGHRFALYPIPAGAWVCQYGQPFARSKGLAPGDPVNDETVENIVPQVDADSLTLQPSHLPPWEGTLPTFQGFYRPDGQVGVRNWVLIVPMSMCSSHEAAQIAARAEMQGLYTRERYPNVDGVTAIPHTGGCGCPYPQAGARERGTLENTLRILAQHIGHPNIGAALLIELGCEKTNLATFDAYFGTDGLTARYGKPVLRLSIQEDGGSQATIARGLALLPELLAEANQTSRRPAPLSALALGLECGGSDAFSGLSANPALGQASDLLVRCGGRSVISEVPEFFGAEHLFAQRAVNREVAAGILALLEWYRAHAAARGGHSMTENPSPGNREGGLLNITIKSLGALAKSGSAPVVGVLNYGGWVWDHADSGIYMLNTPGYDPPSVTGLVGAGCQLVCFTTGRGSVFGNAIAPVIKIASNDALYARMSGDMDVNAGAVISGTRTLPEMGQAIFDEILAVASGKLTKAEINGHREFNLWEIEGLLL
ncbi:MAG TPA: altronate dehydratase family protein [Anaerolineae bacterium]|nr:altronate dehydratase family protein [Anaerolineae bacterium]HQK14845.1 altronate dehydratase family protein [Anaerolineae bacterium]